MITTMVNSSFGNGDVFLWMLEFFLFVIWFWLLIVVFTDLFRDHEASGGVKTLWVILLILLPYLGVLLYLIFRGHGMAQRSAKQQQAMEAQAAAQVRAMAGTSASAGDQIAQAKTLLDSGAISQAEFDTMKSKILAG